MEGNSLVILYKKLEVTWHVTKSLNTEYTVPEPRVVEGTLHIIRFTTKSNLRIKGKVLRVQNIKAYEVRRSSTHSLARR